MAEWPWAEAFNGAIGQEQLAWLESQLTDAAEKGQRALILCHLPLLESAASSRHLLWNRDELLLLLRRHSPVVAAWINGHYHPGGYAFHEGVHHITVNAVLETSPEHPTTAAVLSVFQDRLLIQGFGDCPSHVLSLPC
ncbi:MAG: hypothetical protein Q8P67_06980 [archaeon]|nr:hypothetical protein [archaeon]